MPSESGRSPEDGLERFAPTGGRVTGVVGIVLAVAVAVVWLVDPENMPPVVAAATPLAGVLAWASLLRPRVSASRETLHLRNMLETIRIPLAAIDELVVRQVLTVRVGDRKFVSPAVGRKLRKVMRAPRAAPILGPDVPDAMEDALGPVSESQHVSTEVDYVDHVEGRLRDLVAEARTRHGITRYSDEAEALAREVRRDPAWPEIAGLVLSVGLLVLVILL